MLMAVQMKLFRSQKPQPSAPRSLAPQDGVDLSTRIESFPYTTSIPVITPTQQRALASIPPDARNDAILTAPPRRQSLRARSSDEDPWIVINDSVAYPPMDTALMESQENIREGAIHSQQEKSWTRNLNPFGGTGGAKDKEANAELTRMIGLLSAVAPDDWNLVLEVCEHSSANENAAKEASRALRREFKYGEPSIQLNAARLWAIMLQNATDTFILQMASRTFLDNLEEVINAEGTSPVVRERLLEVLAAAAYMYGKKPGKEGFMSSWKRVRPTWKPVEGVPFDPQDIIFDSDSAFPRRGAPPGQSPLPPSQQPQQQAQQPISDRERRKDRRRHQERDKYLQQQRQLELSQQQHQVLRSNHGSIIGASRGQGASSSSRSSSPHPLPSLESDDEVLMAPFKPSEKAFGKQRGFKKLPNEELKAELFIWPTALPDVESEEAIPSVHYIYDAATERAKELDRMGREEKERERPRREQTRSSMQSVPCAVESSSVVTSSALIELMDQKVPEDLTGKVTVPDFRRPAYGGFAAVHRGKWNGRTVAVKVLKATKNPKKPARWEASMERRLRREIRVWAALSHPNIAEFLGFADDFGDFTAMISTWYHLGTANDYLSENKNITRQGRIRLVQDVAHGLKYLHGLRIIHGDLKPTNVLIDDHHVARLCDFGLVRLDNWQGPAGMTTTSPYTGTERYKAPELFMSGANRHPVATCEGDIYALGCIILEFMDSRLPYERCYNSYELLKAITEGEPPASRPKGQHDTRSNRDLWYIVEACWASHPENRLKVDQVVEELAHFSEALSTVYTDLGEAD